MGRAFEYRRAAKEKRWATMSRIFPKLAKAITVSAKSGGSDPDMNPTLRLAIQNAKKQNMPKDNITAAIKRAEGKDATTRTVANVKSYFSKTGGSMVPNGSLEYLFDRKVVVEFKKTNEMDLEEMELEMIDFGLERFESDDDTIYAYGDYKDFGTLTGAFEKMNIEVEKADLQRLPTSPVDYSDEQMQDIEKLLDKLEDDEDVQNIFTNMA